MLYLMSVRLKIAAGMSAKYTGQHDTDLQPLVIKSASKPEGKKKGVLAGTVCC